MEHFCEALREASLFFLQTKIQVYEPIRTKTVLSKNRLVTQQKSFILAKETESSLLLKKEKDKIKIIYLYLNLTII